MTVPPENGDASAAAVGVGFFVEPSSPLLWAATNSTSTATAATSTTAAASKRQGKRVILAILSGMTVDAQPPSTANLFLEPTPSAPGVLVFSLGVR